MKIFFSYYVAILLSKASIALPCLRRAIRSITDLFVLCAVACVILILSFGVHSAWGVCIADELVEGMTSSHWTCGRYGENVPQPYFHHPSPCTRIQEDIGAQTVQRRSCECQTPAKTWAWLACCSLHTQAIQIPTTFQSIPIFYISPM
jgi:hypothetical protein